MLGLHFFNPVPVLSLVEIIPSLLTDEAVTARARTFAAEQLGKDPIVAPDRAGFTVNALLVPYLLSAIRMFEQGLASAEDIDKGMVKGCAHPMGPLALADLIGLDTVMGVAETLYARAPRAAVRAAAAAAAAGRRQPARAQERPRASTATNDRRVRRAARRDDPAARARRAAARDRRR